MWPSPLRPGRCRCMRHRPPRLMGRSAAGGRDGRTDSFILHRRTRIVEVALPHPFCRHSHGPPMKARGVCRCSCSGSARAGACAGRSYPAATSSRSAEADRWAAARIRLGPRPEQRREARPHRSQDPAGYRFEIAKAAVRRRLGGRAGRQLLSGEDHRGRSGMPSLIRLERRPHSSSSASTGANASVRIGTSRVGMRPS
jgi:hypothetical protein